MYYTNRLWSVRYTIRLYNDYMQVVGRLVTEGLNTHRLCFQTVTSLYESVVPPSEKCINYVKSVEDSRTEEKILTPKSDIVNSVVEAETHLTVLEPEEALANTVAEDVTELSEAVLEKNQEREIPVEVEIVELTTSVKEILQFPEIEEIPDSGKTSEVGEVGFQLSIIHVQTFISNKFIDLLKQVRSNFFEEFM